MGDKTKNIIDTLMTREDFMVGTKKILAKIKEINRILKEQHQRYHKNNNTVCTCKQNNSHPSFG